MECCCTQSCAMAGGWWWGMGVPSLVEPPRHSPSHLLAHTCSVDAGWPRERGLPGSAHRTIAAAGGGRRWAAPAAMPARQPCQVSRKHAPRTADGPPHGAVGSESSPKPGSLLCCAPLAGLLLCSSPTCPRPCLVTSSRVTNMFSAATVRQTFGVASAKATKVGRGPGGLPRASLA